MKIFDNAFIEIEFAINKKNELYLFQIRPIIKKFKNTIKTPDNNIKFTRAINVFKLKL